MQNPQGARPRARSPFAAAFLSLLFPGLGQAYAGAPIRALGFAAAPILLVALGAGVLLRIDRLALVGLVVNPFVLTSVFVVNLIALVYRLVAIVDAYRVAEFVNARSAAGDGRLGPARVPGNVLSVAGLLAVILVMAGSHVVVARYDLPAGMRVAAVGPATAQALSRCDLIAAVHSGTGLVSELGAGGQRSVRLHRPEEEASTTEILGHGPEAAAAVVDLLVELGLLSEVGP